jgi:Macrocin-O-methyltransferase (TylF)
MLKSSFYKLADRIMRLPYWSTQTSAIDVDVVACKQAAISSADYVQRKMRSVDNYANGYDLLESMSSAVHPDLIQFGHLIECGVGSAKTLNHLARIFSNKLVKGFDSFDGLPENWYGNHRQGAGARETLPYVRKNCRLYVGMFDQTLPKFERSTDEPIALLHVDCDLYSSTVTVLNSLERLIVPGTIIVFSGYINYPGWQEDSHRAWAEHVDKNKINYSYIGRVSCGHQVAIRINE